MTCNELRKAYSIVPRNILWEAMARLKMSVVKNLYKDNVAPIKVQNRGNYIDERE